MVPAPSLLPFEQTDCRRGCAGGADWSSTPLPAASRGHAGGRRGPAALRGEVLPRLQAEAARARPPRAAPGGAAAGGNPVRVLVPGTGGGEQG